MLRLVLILLVGLLTTACSAEQVYSNLQEYERSQCVRGPQVEYEDCMARQEMDYREYRALDPAEPSAPRAGNAQIVRNFVAAFNQQDVPAMLMLTTHDVRWMSVDGDSVSVETGNSAELREAMQQYFADRPSSHSVLLDLSASGDFVTTLEQAGSIDQRGQCATAVYEFAGDLIRNVWYYPAHNCEPVPAD